MPARWIHRKKGSPYWHFDFQIEGRRFHGSTKITNEREAKQYVKTLRGQVQREASTRLIQEKTPLNYAAGLYWQQKAMHHTSHKTTEYQTENLLRLIGTDTAVEAIDDRTVADFVAKRRGEAHKKFKEKDNAPLISPSSVNREIELLGRILKYVRKIDKIQTQEIDWKEHRLTEPPPPDRPLSDAEEKRLFAELVLHSVPIIDLSLLTGKRREEIIKLDWSQINMRSREVTFLLSKKGHPNGIPQRLPFDSNGWIFKLFRELGPRETGRVFVFGINNCNCSFCEKHAGEPIRSVRTAFEGARKRAGLPKFRIQDLRHTVGSRVTRHHGIKAASEILGHSDISVTTRYAHYEDGDRLKFMDSLSSSRSRINTETATVKKLKPL